MFDQSERKRFEQQLLSDIATAGSIPVHHLHIEEVITTVMNWTIVTHSLSW